MSRVCTYIHGSERTTESLVEALVQHPNLEDIKALADKTRDDVQAQVLCAKANVFDVLIQVVKTNLDNDLWVRAACDLLANIMSDYAFSMNACSQYALSKLMTEVLKRRDNLSAGHACRCLFFLASSGRQAKEEAITAVLALLGRHGDKPVTLLAHAWRALNGVFLEKNKLGVVQAAIDAMKTQQNRPDILEHVCCSLSAVYHNHLESPSSQEATRLVVEVIGAHARTDHEQLLKVACTTLGNMVRQKDNALFCGKAGANVVVMVLRNNQNFGILGVLCIALANIMAANNVDVAFGKEAVQVVVDVVRRADYAGNTDVLVDACRALYNMVVPTDENQPLFNHDAVHALLDVVQRHTGNPNAVIHACRVLSVLVENPINGAACKDSVTLLLDVARRHFDIADVSRYACRVLANMELDTASIDKAGIETMVGVVRRFASTCVRSVEPACVVLATQALDERNQLHFDETCVEAMLELVRREDLPPDLLHNACIVLAVLVGKYKDAFFYNKGATAIAQLVDRYYPEQPSDSALNVLRRL